MSSFLQARCVCAPPRGTAPLSWPLASFLRASNFGSQAPTEGGALHPLSCFPALPPGGAPSLLLSQQLLASSTWPGWRSLSSGWVVASHACSSWQQESPQATGSLGRADQPGSGPRFGVLLPACSGRHRVRSSGCLPLAMQRHHLFDVRGVPSTNMTAPLPLAWLPSHGGEPVEEVRVLSFPERCSVTSQGQESADGGISAESPRPHNPVTLASAGLSASAGPRHCQKVTPCVFQAACQPDPQTRWDGLALTPYSPPWKRTQKPPGPDVQATPDLLKEAEEPCASPTTNKACGFSAPEQGGFRLQSPNCCGFTLGTPL